MTSFRFSTTIKDNVVGLNDASKARHLTISSIINAWNMIPFEVLQKSFVSSGLYPFNPEIPSNNPLANHSSNVSGPKRRGKINIANQDLTSDQNRLLFLIINMAQIYKV